MTAEQRHAAEHTAVVSDQFVRTLIAPLVARIEAEAGDLVQSHGADESGRRLAQWTR